MQENQKPELNEAFDRHQMRPGPFWHSVICACIAIVVAILLVLVITGPAEAQTVATWEKLNNACQSVPQLANGNASPLCKERNKVTAQLADAGWMQANHGVWLSPEQQNFAGRVIAKYDGQLGANMGAYGSLVPALLVELRQRLTDAQIFAIWNERQVDIAANAPYGAALMEEVMSKLALHYSRSGDPRLALGN